MKAKENDRIKTLVDVRSERLGRTLPAGTLGTIVDAPTKGEPEEYFVDVGEHPEFDNISLTPEQFEVVRTA
jgi:hypothetical protein